MWRAREADPAFVAECHAKIRAVLEVPGDVVAVDLQDPPAAGLLDDVVADSEVKWVAVAAAKTEVHQRESLDEGLRPSPFREPCSPYLNRLSDWFFRATVPARIE